ncbi:MAG: enoyl-CoA hydratase/isomerase family protein [Methyloceanibacter sp.]|uniref:enoyl-CoA hydratase/isomerase family protein n=1 Tax=Methyloceanibacter sp. TaxID=1965321 RepID=UPI003D9AF548
MSEALGISFEEIDRAGVVTLNRPSRLNALSREMFEALSAQYRRWAPASHIYGVVMESAHPTVFSSGGDLKVLHELSEQGALQAIREFYRAAYTHVWVLEKFIRPNVPLINGLAFGGGVGITLFGTHCVAGEGYRFAMPQVGIGFLPDIGGTYFLPRLLGWTGLYLALTGRVIGPADAFRLKLASHYIPSAHFGVIKDALSDNHPIDRLLDGLHRDPGEGEIVRFTPAINRTFSAPSVEEILARLDAEHGEDKSWAQETAATLREKSPTSLKVAFAQMQRGKSLDLADALRLEFRLASHLVSRPDYREGVAARIAGKGRAPQWNPDTLTAVNDDDIERMFTTPVDDELVLNETAQNNQQ